MTSDHRPPAPAELLNAVLEGAPVILYALDAEGVFTLSEGSALHSLGLRSGEVMGRSVFEVYADHPDLLENIEAVLRGEHRSWIQQIGNLYFDSKARPAPDGGVHGVATDITPYKRGERALRTAVHHYQRLVETSPYGIYALDEEGRFIEVNRAAAEIMGRDREDLLGRAHTDFTAAEDIPRADESLQRKLRAEVDRTSVEVHLVRPDGERRLVDIRAVAITDAGKVVGSHGTINDITEEREREAHMRLMIRVLQDVRQGVSIIRDHDEVVFRNQAFYDLFGIDSLSPERDRLLGQDLIVGDDAGLQKDEMERSLAERGHWTGRVRHRRLSDSTVLVLDLTAGRVQMEDGRLVDFTVLDDATEIVERERWLRRTERLTTLGTLAGGVAHELNNPLAAVHGFAQLLVGAELGADEREAAEMIAREAARAARIVSDFRRIVTVEDRDSQFDPVDLNDLARHVIKLRKYALATRDIEIRADLCASLDPVRGDAGRLEQALLNLVINAEHAVSEQGGTGVIRIRTRRTDDRVTLSVEDNGPGIPEEVRERMFDPFWTTKEPGKGMGLGLSIVHQIVAEHGGRIEAENARDAGALFTIALPAAAEAESDVEADRSEPRAISEQRRILVIDDEPSIRMMLQRFLGRLGHVVRTASDGREGWALMEAEGPKGYDLILTDLRMPGLDGPGLYDRVRERMPEAEPLVAFMTGDATGEEIAAIGPRAEQSVLLKPFDLQDLEDFIEARLASVEASSGRPDRTGAATDRAAERRPGR